jgi:hypothetical protein
VEATEEKLINDRDIMDGTVIENQDHSGRIRFKTTLPSGRDLNSEWIQASDKTKAGILWVAAVRQQIVADSEESAARARRELKELKAAQPAVPQFVGPDGSPLASSGLSTPVAAPSLSPTLAMLAPAPTSLPAASPAAYVKAQYTAARQRLNELKEERERINFEYAEAVKVEAQWFGLLQAMGGISVEEGNIGRVGSSAVGGTGNTVRGNGLSEHTAAELPTDSPDTIP